jgi:AcrR family transcriptional regulator
LTDRSIAAEEKRSLILAAAVRVFARRGYHTCRVSDIAEEAGVAHGLLYHYFSSKEEVLETVVRETWSDLLHVLHEVEESPFGARDRLRQLAAALLRWWRRDPDLVGVLVRELARSPQLQRAGEVGRAVEAVDRIVARGQAEGELRGDLDSRLASWIFYGAIEGILTGWVLGKLPDGDDDVSRAEGTVVSVLCEGLAVERAAVP